MKTLFTMIITLILCLPCNATDAGTTGAANIPCPIVYVPGMFDNGDLLVKDSLLVKNLNNEDGFYYKGYFTAPYAYDKEPLVCSSSIVNAKYNRLIVANVTGPRRTDISIVPMARRLFCLLQGRSPRYCSYDYLTNYKGCDYTGTVERGGKIITFKGVIEEIWAKYGKRVYYRTRGAKNMIVIEPRDVASTAAYTNPDGYFDSYRDIKFNFVAHSSGGIALREYIRLVKSEGLPVPVNVIVNLSVPQRGARLVYSLKSAFPNLLSGAMNKFFARVDSGSITIQVNGAPRTFTYKELIQKTRVDMLHGDSTSVRGMQSLLGNYILYFIPFDGVDTMLGTDPTLYDLTPHHALIKRIEKSPLPAGLRIHNFRVRSPFAPMFKALGSFLNLGDNDGVVDFRDSGLDHLPGSSTLSLIDHEVMEANHIPFPYIRAVFELRETITKNYGFLSILLKERVAKDEGITIIQAVMSAIMIEFGLDLDYLLKHENYSVIDYYAEHPVEF